MKIQLKFGIKNLFFITMCVVFIIEMNPTFKENTMLRYGVILLCFALFCLRCIQSKWFPIDLFWVWSIGELGFCILSSFWSLDSETTIQACKNVFIVLFVCSMTYSIVKNEDDFLTLWKIICIACVFDSLYVLFIVGFDNLGTARLGVDYAGLELWNANAIGAFAGFGCIMFLYNIVKSTNFYSRMINTSIALFLLFVSLYSGSRKAFLVIVITVVLYLYLKDRGNKRLRNIFIMLFLLMVLWNAIMMNNNLYELIGARMERMFDSLMGRQTTENSMSMRTLMIIQGADYFGKRPILGYGLDCYRYLSSFHSYAHNNYIELMVDTGLIGLIVYYSIYIYTFIKISYFAFKRHDDMALFLFSVLVIIVVNHFSIVAYYDITYTVMFLLIVSYIKLLKKVKCD